MRHITAAGFVDTFPFLGSLYERRAEFDKVTFRQDYPGSPHRDTRAIFLQGPAEFAEVPLWSVHRVPDPAAWFHDVRHIPYPALLSWPEAEALLTAVLEQVPAGTMGKAMLVELKPGGALAWHVDEGEYAQRFTRYHLALTTNPFCSLYSGGEQAHVPVGCLVQFDTSVLHSACNLGPTPRIHLIVDVRKEATRG